MSQFPRLETKRLILDKMLPSDSNELYKIFSNPEVTQYYDLDTFTCEDDAIKLIRDEAVRFKEKKMLRWALREKYTNNLIGGCGINRFESSNHVAIIGYEISREAWGKGFATEAVDQVIKFAFSPECPNYVNRVEAYIMYGNNASESILGKLGFKYEGTLREYGYWKKQYHDLKVFSLLRSDFQKKI